MLSGKLRFILSALILPALFLGELQPFRAAVKLTSANRQAEPTAKPFIFDGDMPVAPPGPLSPDGEVGENDLRVSYMGRDIQFDAYNPAIAYNSTDNEYLLVWYADDDDNYLADDEFEIYAQRMSAVNGSLLGPVIPVSNMGTNGYADYDALNPAVAYNSNNNQYLVVWEADSLAGSLVNDEFEIYGQILSAAGAELDTDDFRISDMAVIGDAAYDAIRPAVAYNSADNQYLVVWQGDNGAPLANDENEIYGQLLNYSGLAFGVNDFRISDMGPDGNASYDATSPAVAYNSAGDEYLVVWTGGDDNGGMVLGESEVFGQRLDSAGGSLGSNDFRISDLGGSGDPAFDAYYPDVAYNSHDNQYLVVWHGDDNTSGHVDEEFEIYGQRLEANGSGTGTNDSRLSDMGPVGNTAYRAEYPAVTYNSTDNQYLVVWAGVDDETPLEAGEQEIFGQRMYADSGAGVGGNDFRISFMGPNGNSPYWAYRPAVAYTGSQNEYLVGWYGDHDRIPLINDEFEIFSGRLHNDGTFIYDTYQLRVSYMDPIGDPGFGAAEPAIAIDPDNSEGIMVVWSGDTNLSPLVENETEIFVRSYEEMRVSFMGPNGNTSRGAYEPDIACNTSDHEYLVVWRGDDDIDNEYEIYGQLLTSYGSSIGTNFRISDMGPDADPAYGAFSPQVVYNSHDNQYLVVWTGDDDSGSLVDNEYEIYGQFLDADGAAIGTNDFRISDMGGTGNAAFGATDPAVAYHSALNQYLVVWSGDDNTGSLVDNEFEIFGQLIEANGAGAGPNDFRISDMGGTGNALYNAYSPETAYNSELNEYLVVWSGDDNTAPLVDDEYEIFGQRMSSTAGGLGPNDFRISSMGPDGNASYDAYEPAVQYSTSKHIYLVAWHGDNGPPLADDEYEIYGRYLSQTGVPSGEPIRISDMGPDGSYQYRAAKPAISVFSSYFFVLWEGDDNTPPLVNEEFEIFGQLLEPYRNLYLPAISKGP